MSIPKYYESEDAFERIHHELKQIPCPFCRLIGCLILHGFLSGYSDTNGTDKVRRGHRIFCSNRKRRKGCGRTCSILLARFITHMIVTAHTLWHFFKGVAVLGCKAKAMRSASMCASQSAPYNLWRRLRANVPHIRTTLLKITDPPHTASTIAEVQTILHLDHAFPGSPNPVIDFQFHFQTSLFAYLPPQSGLLA